ncbi:type IV pilin [Halobacterium wangiae]|uniref:type IV pilin n=1 Tax=Halobacterium wangiae TaxID=2902623 RepID=UPI001E3EA3D5|nr:type IV pilin [Halobacterium wangiae]
MARGYAPVAVVLLLVVTVVAAAVVALALPELSAEPPPNRGVVAEATADGRVSLTLVSGPEITVGNLDVRVVVDGEPLDHQPPVPFFAARGFHGGPTGPFNVADDSTWRVGESTAFSVAATNDPALSAGADVEVELRVRGRPVAGASTTVEEQS